MAEKYRCSFYPGGHKFDLVSDSLANAVAFIGIGIGLRDSALGLWAPALGVIAGAAVAMVLWLVMRLEDGGGERAGELSGFSGADPDDAMIVVPIVMAVGGAMPLLIAAAVGAPAFAAIFYFLFRRTLKAANRRPAMRFARRSQKPGTRR